MPFYDALLKRGYFPRELPPTFHTISFAAAMAKKTGPALACPGAGALTRLAFHNLAQAGTLRRRLGIPNPIAAHHTALAVENHWTAIEAHLGKSTLSISSPIATPPRAFAPKLTFGDLPRARAKTRSVGKYLLTADISRFYASIYTHSIPWAIHGKAWSKANKSGGCGNDLDRAIRSGQDGQTLGVPIGPDTSFVVAECILAAVDDRFGTFIGPVHGHRFMDDYEIAFPTYDRALSAMGALQEALAELELALNPTKTSIIDLPTAHEGSWVAELREALFRSGGKGLTTDLIRYFDIAYRLADANRDAHVLNYAVSRLRSVWVDPGNWPLLQHMLFQAILAEPKTFRPAAEQFLSYKAAGYGIDTTLLTEAVNVQIGVHAPLGHSSEVAWALWCALSFRIQVSAIAANHLGKTPDCIIALHALDCRSRGLIPTGLDTTAWETVMTTEDLRGEQWLLSYEARLKGWLPSKGVADHIATDPFFSALRAAAVSFYDPSLTTLPIFSSPIMVGGTVAGGGGDTAVGIY